MDRKRRRRRAGQRLRVRAHVHDDGTELFFLNLAASHGNQ